MVRLKSQAALIQAGLDADGLWTLSRGLARTRSSYLAKLQSADFPRQGSLDGRGNLSETRLTDFSLYFLGQIVDQLKFMGTVLAPLDLVERIRHYLILERQDLDSKLRERLTDLLKVLCLEGPIRRGDVATKVGLKSSTTARQVISEGLSQGVNASWGRKARRHSL